MNAVRRWWPLLAVGGLLAVAAVAAALSSPQVTDVPIPLPTRSIDTLPTGNTLPTQGPAEGSGDSQDPARLPIWLMNVALGLCAAAVVAIIVVVVWILVRDTMSVRRGSLPVDGTGAGGLRPNPDDVVAALDAGLSDLSDADLDPRRAVIACWIRLEQAAAAAGTPRHTGDTSTDHVLRLLRAHRVDRQILDRFAEIYREARYATHPIDEHMRGQARSALHRLRQELVVSAEAVP